MRHLTSNRKFGMKTNQRLSMFKNMAASLFRHERIKTTLPRAKELRRVVERLITLARQDSVHRRRLVASRLGDADMLKKLFTDIAPFYQSRPGGYLRILKCGFRAGDCAPMALVELVDREEKAAN